MKAEGDGGNADKAGRTGGGGAPAAGIGPGDGRALSVEYRPAASLIPYARNARTHSEAQVAQIAASIREFGFCNPILCDADNGVIAGHGRLLAARKLGMADVPVIVLAGLSEAIFRNSAQVCALLRSANRIFA